MKPLISVIVPIYKVEEYLECCINSLINQTYENLEIILVDDGSPDNCPKICDEYAKRDSRIKVIHKENGGLSDARNAGMRVARGEYLSFIDSDDSVYAGFFEKLLGAMQKHNADITECSVLKTYGEKPKLEETSEDECLYDTKQALAQLIDDQNLKQHVWNKLYRREVSIDIPFEKGKYNEDEFWTYQVFGKACRVAKISLPMYYYLQRGGSIMGEGYSLKRLDALEGKMLRQKYIDKNYPELSTKARINFIDSCMYAYQMALKKLSKEDFKKAKGIILEYVHSFPITAKDKKSLKGRQKLWTALMGISFTATARLKNLLKVGF